MEIDPGVPGHMVEFDRAVAGTVKRSIRTACPGAMRPVLAGGFSRRAEDWLTLHETSRHGIDDVRIKAAAGLAGPAAGGMAFQRHVESTTRVFGGKGRG